MQVWVISDKKKIWKEVVFSQLVFSEEKKKMREGIVIIEEAVARKLLP